MAVIEPIRRALVVLEALSRRRSTKLSLLVTETGLPRPTVVRLLHTLIELGYASHVSREVGYRLTDQVLALAGGMRFVDHLIDAAIAPMAQFTEDHGWPLYLATISSGAMAIRHSTAVESPMAFETAGFNFASPLLFGALGRAWLAYASEEQRTVALGSAGLRQTRALAMAFDRIRHDGYAFARAPKPTRIHGLGVPILRRDRLLGSLSMRFPRSAMNEADAAARFAKPLADVADAIARNVEQSSAQEPASAAPRLPHSAG
jgi:IclR family mhp operon transcriptional activator